MASFLFSDICVLPTLLDQERKDYVKWLADKYSSGIGSSGSTRSRIGYDQQMALGGVICLKRKRRADIWDKANADTIFNFQ